MKMSRLADEFRKSVERISYQAEKIKDCCLMGRKQKYKTRPKMCPRCKQRMASILNRLK